MESLQGKFRRLLESWSVDWLEKLGEKNLGILREIVSEALKGLIKADCNIFSQEILGYRNDQHQKEWYKVLSDRTLRYIVLAAPRGHTKTTCFSVNYPLWEISSNPNVRILLVSNAESQSQSFLREIVSHVERNEEFIGYAGKLKPDIPEKWTNREIILNRSQVNLKDPTISTVGVGGTILSKRADIIICDDILNIENTKTAEQRQKLKDWFYQVLMPVLVPGGRVIFVGTVWHPQDLLHELLEDPTYDYRKKFKAVIKEPENKDLWEQWYQLRLTGTPESKVEADKFFAEKYDEMHKGVEVLWKMFSYRDLFLLKRANSVAFEKAYQNNIVSREDQKFKEEWLEAAKQRGANLRLVKSLNADQRKEFKVLTGGIDLAASEDAQADDNAMTTLGERRLDNMVQVVSLDAGKFSPKEWRSTIKDRYVDLKHDRILVESNGYQVALKRDLGDENIPIVGFTTGGEKFDPYIGVESLAILFENNRIVLPYDKSDPYTITMIDRLVDELRAFPVGHTGDVAMSMWFAFTAMRDMMGKAKHGFLQMVEQDLQAAKTGKINAWQALAQRGTPLQ